MLILLELLIHKDRFLKMHNNRSMTLTKGLYILRIVLQSIVLNHLHNLIYNEHGMWHTI